MDGCRPPAAWPRDCAQCPGGLLPSEDSACVGAGSHRNGALPTGKSRGRDWGCGASLWEGRRAGEAPLRTPGRQEGRPEPGLGSLAPRQAGHRGPARGRTPGGLQGSPGRPGWLEPQPGDQHSPGPGAAASPSSFLIPGPVGVAGPRRSLPPPLGFALRLVGNEGPLPDCPAQPGPSPASTLSPPNTKSWPVATSCPQMGRLRPHMGVPRGPPRAQVQGWLQVQRSPGRWPLWKAHPGASTETCLWGQFLRVPCWALWGRAV